LSLVEIVVGLAILVIALGGIYGLVSQSVRSFGVSEDFLDVQQNARVALGKLAEEAKWAQAVSADSPTCSWPSCVELSVSADNPIKNPPAAYTVRFQWNSGAQQTGAGGGGDGDAARGLHYRRGVPLPGPQWRGYDGGGGRGERRGGDYGAAGLDLGTRDQQRRLPAQRGADAGGGGEPPAGRATVASAVDPGSRRADGDGNTDGHPHANADGHAHADGHRHPHLDPDSCANCPAAHFDGDPDAGADDPAGHCHGHGDPDADPDADARPDSDPYGHGDAHRHPDADAGAHGDADGHAHSHPHADADGHPDGHAAAAVRRARR